MFKGHRSLSGLATVFIIELAGSYQEENKVAMSGKFQPLNQNTAHLLLHSLQDWLPEKHQAAS
jgi:hypothetical protein